MGDYIQCRISLSHSHLLIRGTSIKWQSDRSHVNANQAVRNGEVSLLRDEGLEGDITEVDARQMESCTCQVDPVYQASAEG